MRRPSIDEHGQSIVEFALTFPVAILLILGSIQVILAVAAKVIVSNAAFDGARSAAVSFAEEPEKARSNAESVVAERSSGMPVGPGFLVGSPEIVGLTRHGDEIALAVEGRVKPLPPFDLVVEVTGGDGLLHLISNAIVKLEPFTGESR